jgi:hypothetical protein
MYLSVSSCLLKDDNNNMTGPCEMSDSFMQRWLSCSQFCGALGDIELAPSRQVLLTGVAQNLLFVVEGHAANFGGARNRGRRTEKEGPGEGLTFEHAVLGMGKFICLGRGVHASRWKSRKEEEPDHASLLRNWGGPSSFCSPRRARTTWGPCRHQTRRPPLPLNTRPKSFPSPSALPYLAQCSPRDP